MATCMYLEADDGVNKSEYAARDSNVTTKSAMNRIRARAQNIEWPDYESPHNERVRGVRSSETPAARSMTGVEKGDRRRDGGRS